MSIRWDLIGLWAVSTAALWIGIGTHNPALTLVAAVMSILAVLQPWS